MTKRLQFRSARATDAPYLAEICLCADGDTFDFLLHGLGSHLDVKDIMTALCRTDSTVYSYRYFTLAVDDECVLGGFNAIPSADMARLDQNLVAAPFLARVLGAIVQFIQYLFGLFFNSQPPFTFT